MDMESIKDTRRRTMIAGLIYAFVIIVGYGLPVTFAAITLQDSINTWYSMRLLLVYFWLGLGLYTLLIGIALAFGAFFCTPSEMRSILRRLITYRR